MWHLASFKEEKGETMKKKQEETYQLTFKGLVNLHTGMSEATTTRFLDALELYLRRLDHNAVILTKAGEFETHNVYLGKEK
jgi:hypothetical protein